MSLLSATSFSFIRRTDDDPPHLTPPTLWSLSSPLPFPPPGTRNHLNLPEPVWNGRKMSSSTITQVGSLESVCLERRFYRFLNVILEFDGSAAVLNVRPNSTWNISAWSTSFSPRREELWTLERKYSSATGLYDTWSLWYENRRNRFVAFE